jgi:hypothetical protein
MDELISQKYLLLNRASNVRAKIGGRSYPRFPEPKQKFSQWDYVLEEMKWLAWDFIAERRHKRAEAFLLAKEASFSQRKLERENQAKENLGKSIGKKCSGMIHAFFAESYKKEWAIVDRSSEFLMMEKVFQKENAKPIHSYAIRIIEEFGLEVGNPDDIRAMSPAPSTVDTESFDLSDVTAKLFYSIDDYKACDSEIKNITETDVDLYAPTFDLDLFQ